MSEQEEQRPVFDPATLGKATEYRAIDVSEMPGRFETAAAGYEWAQLPGGMFGMGCVVLVCARCCAFVVSAEGHDLWHSRLIFKGAE